ncbi:cytochrome b/b6 domain-containing protein [Azorhizobium doebereinerae]|uniref:cytochrome b/b6 domain-containing protein n=1 Tax=Azorhizobium doebereinerae TaxID=281091 RepID=UPI0004109B66|nr:cytochrome b/b6 domain-containing protein [Azorhizobium doebereinerae]
MSGTPSRWVKVWDAPTRLFHWSLVLLVAGAYATAELGLIDWHFRVGYAILALLLFRLAWGFLGSDTARFARFLASPLEALRHLAHFTRRGPDTEIGHNAAGGWMVLVMLALLLFQAGSGLFSNDEVMAEGPLAKFVGSAWSDRISGWHVFNFNLILALVGLHVLAVLAYAAVKRHDLVRPMVTGMKRLPAGLPAPRMASAALAAGLFLAAAAIAWVIATRL